MKISNLDHMEEITSAVVRGGAITLNFDGPIGVVFIAAAEQKATGKVATNNAEVGINFFDSANFKFYND